ncbi:InlB B-repeat-containing protein [Methanolapillus millepedarum]|uniref:Bacterial repeat domain-containing protein n=1 Tax=Methanolapillus millepedarum TaxID=3028296 RepID=A0AA96ZUS7_9EURY|nr:hypothetical protein MsAc7_01750 [Methanosarcinaceae archaeon Ac7]
MAYESENSYRKKRKRILFILLLLLLLSLLSYYDLNQENQSTYSCCSCSPSNSETGYVSKGYDGNTGTPVVENKSTGGNNSSEINYILQYLSGTSDPVFGMPTPSSKSLPSGVPVTVADAPTRSDYMFSGWSDGTQTYPARQVDAFEMPDSNVTLTALWTVNSYQLTYEPGTSDPVSGMPSPASTPVEFGTNVSTVSAPSRTGYTFSGWSDGTDTYSAGEADAFEMPKNDVTLTALWTVNSYQLTYEPGTSDPVSGMPSPASTPVEFGTNVSTAPAPSRTGYAFSGWSDGTHIYSAGEVDAFEMPNADVILTAQWVPNLHTLTYVPGNGPENNPPVPVSATGMPDPLSSPVGFGTVVTVAEAPSSFGYIFQGWSDGTTTYPPDQTFSMPDKDVTLTAKWTPKMHYVTAQFFDTDTRAPIASETLMTYEGGNISVFACIVPGYQLRGVGLKPDGLDMTNGDTFRVENVSEDITVYFFYQRL